MPKYAWIGNRISDKDMYQLYLLKEQTRVPITKLVAEAIRTFVNGGATLKGVSVTLNHTVQGKYNLKEEGG